MANQALDFSILKEVAEGKWEARRANAKRCCLCGASWP